MTNEEVIDTFISIGEKFLKGNKHFHLEPILARDIIQAIKELKKENTEQKEIIESLQLKLNTNGCDSATDYMLYLKQREISRRYRQKNTELMKRIKSLQVTDLQKENDILQVKIHRMKYCVKAMAKHSINPRVRKAMKELLRRWE